MKKMLRRKLLQNYITSILLISIVGCAAKQALEGFHPRGFIEIKDEAQKETNKRFPFDYVWIDNNSSSAKYTKLQLSPFILIYIDNKAWEKSLSAAITSKEDFDEHVQKYSEYFQNKLRESLSKVATPRFALTESPASDALRLEIAITNVSFGSPTAYAASFASPIPGTGVALDAVRSYSATFELRLVDSVTGVILATAGDQNSPRLRPIDLNKLSVSSPLKEVADIWADELTRSLNASPGQNIEAASKISLLPW